MSFWIISAFSTNYPFFINDCKIDSFDSIKDPFFQNIEKLKSDYSLQAIVSNKVKINNIWYALNDSIDGFMIIEITNSQVVLMKKDKVLVLDLYDKNNIFVY
ncbi:hypothetical protein [Campylobacter sp. RM16704]|uniref:hypothetical protein n=1 Tax=Campylobacter sp. RM16704 TaxID=1500960 RepID=UPI0011DE05C8|nr:hypothetical protein [Campylobacter sp. RM16704]